MMLSAVLFGVVLLANHVLDCNALSITSEELLAKMSQEFPNMYSKSYDEACEKVPPPPTNGRVTNQGFTRVSIQFDWEDEEGACNSTNFFYVLYQKEGDVLMSLGLSTYKHLRGVTYEQLKSNREYFVHVYAFYAFTDIKSTNLTIPFKTRPGQSEEITEQDNEQNYLPERSCDKVEEVTDGRATRLTSSSASVAFDWKSIDGDCWGFFLTGLLDTDKKEIASVSGSISPHFRGHFYTNLASDTAFIDGTTVFGNGTASTTVGTPFKTKK